MKSLSNKMSRRGFLLSGAALGLTGLINSSSFAEDKIKNVSEISGYNIREVEWNPENVTNEILDVFGEKNVFNLPDNVDFMPLRNKNWGAETYLVDEQEKSHLLIDKLKDVGDSVLIDLKEKQVYALRKGDSENIGNFPELRIARLGDNGVCAYLSAIQSEGDWMWDVKALVFADINKKRKTILSPNKNKKWETSFFTGDDFMPGFNMSQDGKVAVIYSGSLEEPNMYLVDTDKFEVFHEQKGVYLWGINYNGKVIVTEDEKGYYRTDLKNGEKTFLYKGNDYFQLSPDGNFLVGTSNPLIGLDDSEGNCLDTRGVRIYNHSTGDFFLVNGMEDAEYFGVDADNWGNVAFSESDSHKVELRYQNGTYTVNSNFSDESFNPKKVKIEKVSKVEFKPYS